MWQLPLQLYKLFSYFFINYRFIITSDGKVYENLKIIKKYEKQLVKLQRQLSHKGKRSKNYYKTKKKIALCHEKIRNIRKDYLHKVSHEIISENQVIVSENLQIKNMVKNHHLAKAISDVSWYELTRQLEYKAKWNGRKYIKIHIHEIGIQRIVEKVGVLICACKAFQLRLAQVWLPLHCAPCGGAISFWIFLTMWVKGRPTGFSTPPVPAPGDGFIGKARRRFFQKLCMATISQSRWIVGGLDSTSGKHQAQRHRRQPE